jgi:hypothetical protein
MLHEAIHILRQIRNRALRLAGVHLSELGKGLHPAVEDLISPLHFFDKLARVDVWIAAAGDVVDHFGGDQDGADGGGGGVGGFVGGEIGECGEGMGKVDAVAGLSVIGSVNVHVWMGC